MNAVANTGNFLVFTHNRYRAQAILNGYLNSFQKMFIVTYRRTRQPVCKTFQFYSNVILLK